MNFLPFPSPVFTGEEGPKPKDWEVRVCTGEAASPHLPPLRSGPFLSREERERALLSKRRGEF
jgi:hypothetical protein